MNWIRLIQFFFVPGFFFFLAIIASPRLSFHDDGWIFTKPRKMKNRPGPLVHKNVNSHDFNLKEE